MPDITAKQIQRDFGEILTSVRRGETYDITHYGVKVARLMPYREEPMSEEQGKYTASDLNEQLEQVQREGLAGELAFNAYAQQGGDKQAAIRALAEAILKVQALP